jgi:hypothetical protein
VELIDCLYAAGGKRIGMLNVPEREFRCSLMFANQGGACDTCGVQGLKGGFDATNNDSAKSQESFLRGCASAGDATETELGGNIECAGEFPLHSAFDI